MFSPGQKFGSNANEFIRNVVMEYRFPQIPTLPSPPFPASWAQAVGGPGCGRRSSKAQAPGEAHKCSSASVSLQNASD